MTRLLSLWNRWRPVRHAHVLHLQDQLKNAMLVREALETQIIETKAKVGEHLRLIADIKLALDSGGYLLQRSDTPGEYEPSLLYKNKQFVQAGPVRDVVIRMSMWPSWEASDSRLIAGQLANQITIALLKILSRGPRQ